MTSEAMQKESIFKSPLSVEVSDPRCLPFLLFKLPYGSILHSSFNQEFKFNFMFLNQYIGFPSSLSQHETDMRTW